MKLWEPKWKCSKAVPTHLQSHVVWSQTLECSVKPYVTGPVGPWPNAISMNVYSHKSSHMIQQNKPTVVSVRSAMVSLFCVRPTSKRRSFENSPSDHLTRSIRCHVGIHVVFTVHLAFTYSVGPSGVVWSSEPGPAPPFHHWERLKCNLMVMVSQSRVWSGP